MPDLLRRAGRWCRDRSDIALAVVLTVACAATLAGKGLLARPDAWPPSASVLASAALLGWRRHRTVPLAAAVGALMAFPTFTRYAAMIDNTDNFGVAQVVTAFLFAYSLGADVPWRWSLLGLVPLTAGLALTAGEFNPLAEMLTVGPWLAGLAVASRRRAEARLEGRAHELEREREIFAIHSVRYERARIARELHDIVAHSVSLMVVQAGAGEHLARRDPARAAQAFDSITEAARQAEAEIARLVELLDSSPPAVPTAGLRIVDELVRRVQASGVPISCRFNGDSDDLSEMVAQTAYRLVQESVTNAIKHAPGAPIEIMVRGETDAIEIEIADRPAAGARSGLEGAGGGHGLAGMRERVARCGGTFAAGPTSDLGWRVAARLPRHPGAARDGAAAQAVP